MEEEFVFEYIIQDTPIIEDRIKADPGIKKEPGPNTEEELILMEGPVIHKNPTRTAEQPSPPRYVP